jgi:hypothetical protein
MHMQSDLPHALSFSLCKYARCLCATVHHYSSAQMLLLPVCQVRAVAQKCCLCICTDGVLALLSLARARRQHELLHDAQQQ